MTPPTNDELHAAVAALGIRSDDTIGWRDISMTQLSIARHYGGAKFNGKTFTYFPADDSLWRDDVVQAVQKQRKAAKVAEPVSTQMELGDAA
jgi:muramoyltetrapeptide carboxypeptidase LdcA involved in peptidoglycan recycling